MSPDFSGSTRWPESRAPRGMVASPHLLASQSGIAALRAGGTAVDAAIAAAATIAVVYPHTNGVGGDNVWLIWDARAQKLRALCGAGGAAAAATIDWYAARGITGALPARGGPAALTVPGAVDGWWQAHRMSAEGLGSPLPWKALLADAVFYAREGFSASEGQRRPPPREPDLFGPAASAEMRRGLWPLYHPDALARGPLVQGDLARSLEALRRFDEARHEYEEGRRLSGGVAGPSFGLGHLEASSGNEAGARRILEELIQARSHRVVSAWGIAALHASLGDLDEAFRWLDVAVEERAAGLIFLRVHPRLDPIRQDPRYRALVQREGLDLQA